MMLPVVSSFSSFWRSSASPARFFCPKSGLSEMAAKKTGKNRKHRPRFGVDVRWRGLPGKILTDFMVTGDAVQRVCWTKGHIWRRDEQLVGGCPALDSRRGRAERTAAGAGAGRRI